MLGVCCSSCLERPSATAYKVIITAARRLKEPYRLLRVFVFSPPRRVEQTALECTKTKTILFSKRSLDFILLLLGVGVRGVLLLFALFFWGGGDCFALFVVVVVVVVVVLLSLLLIDRRSNLLLDKTGFKKAVLP